MSPKWLLSTIISWGKNREKEAFESLLDQFPSGPVSVVSDSYDIFNACKRIWGDELKERVMERSADSTLVIRPDSGDVAETLLQVRWATTGGGMSPSRYTVRDWLSLSFSHVFVRTGMEKFSSQQYLATTLNGRHQESGHTAVFLS